MDLSSAPPSKLAEVRGFLGRYRAHLSVVSMLAGFASDYMLLGSIDLPTTQALLSFYLVVAATSIALLHAAEASAIQGFLQRWRNLFPMAIQFALGSLWSGLLVFYSRTAVFATSWPFLLLLLAILIGNEIFHRYVSRLVFSTTLLFFALISLTVLIVPIYVHAIGPKVFLLSGGAAITVFLVYCWMLAWIGGSRFAPARWQMLGGGLAVFAALNIFYFTGVLPPLPLALAASGVYQNIHKSGPVYLALGQPQPWYTRFGWPQTIYLAPGASISVFSSVFAPIALSARIRHEWEWYSPQKHAWLREASVTFTVSGGRNGGYRGYTTKHDPADGQWRVDIETEGDRLIGRVQFRIEHTRQMPPLENIVLH
ncbi:MAG: DUF2914 domain-containing protein [Alphaproteobacteria bacterium]|nr:DUF2914 domain-containing protein [Alphaproteobacteria bacterium]